MQYTLSVSDISMLILPFKKNNERGENIICKREDWIHLAIVVKTFTISWLLDSDPGSIYFLLLTFCRDQRWYWRRGAWCLQVEADILSRRRTVYISLNYRDADRWKRMEAARVVHLPAKEK